MMPAGMKLFFSSRCSLASRSHARAARTTRVKTATMDLIRVLQLALLALCLARRGASQCLAANDSELQENKKAHSELLKSQLIFAADLLRAAASNRSENVFLSPTSVFNAMLMAYFFSANRTEEALRKALRIPKDQGKEDTLWAYSLERYNQKLRSIKGVPEYRLSIANRIYLSSEHKMRDCVEQRFKGEFEYFNQTNLPKTIDKVNGWVSGQTNKVIDKLLSQDSLNDNTNLVLVNAAYFRGFWKNQFSPNQTHEAEFTLANGTTVPVMMMSQEDEFSHSYNEKLEAEVLEMQYSGGNISMFILLPLKNGPKAVDGLIEKLDSDMINLITNRSVDATQVDVKIPQFDIDSSFDLMPILADLGAGELFTGSADLGALTEPSESGESLRLDTAIHRAVIAVDESGSEAAAATAVFANRFGSDPFAADHPFVFMLFEKASKNLLFAGVYNGPQT